MGDERTVTLLGGFTVHGKPDNYTVSLADGASMAREQGQAVIDAARAMFGDANQYQITPVMAVVFSQCPDLFNDQYNAENPQQSE